MIAISLMIVSYLALVILTAIEPSRSRLSDFELKRRQAKHDETVEIDIRRGLYFNDISVWLRLLAGLMLVIFVLASVASFSWVVGVVVAVVGVLCYIAIARLSFIRRRCQNFYDKYEPAVLAFANNNANKLKFLRGASVALQDPLRPSSKDELMHIIDTSGDIVTADEKKFLHSGLEFTDKTIASSMTPRSVVNVVKSDDVVGPLLLDDLHKTGNSRFPVIDGDIDHIVGVLHLRDIISIDIKSVKTASDMMRTPVYYIKDTQTLGHALAAFLRVRNHLFVVVNQYRETVGVITLEDVIEAVIGRKIVDEFDAHEDLRIVAKRNPRGNNSAKSAKNV